MIRFVFISILLLMLRAGGYADSLKESQFSFDQQSVLSDSLKTFSITPNPFSTEVTITCDQEFDQKVVVNLYDPLGNVIRSFSSEYLESASVLKLPVEGNLKDGMYFLEVIDSGQIFRERVFYLGN